MIRGRSTGPQFLAAGRWQIVGPEVAHAVNKALDQGHRDSQAPDLVRFRAPLQDAT